MNELQKTPLQKTDVMPGDFFILSAEKGYSPSQQKKAMQVMECWDNAMTVKCKNGCMTKEYDHFEKITSLDGIDKIYTAKYFEDNRSKRFERTMEKTFEVISVNNRPAIKCLTCQMISFNTNDIEQLYCGYCHKFHEDQQQPEHEESRI